MPGGLPPAPAAAPRPRHRSAAPDPVRASVRVPIRSDRLRPAAARSCRNAEEAGPVLRSKGYGGARGHAATWHTPCSKRSQSTREHLRGRFCSPNLFPTLTHEISDLHPSPHLPASPNHRGKAKQANPRPEPPSYPTQVRQHNDLDSGAAPFTGGRGAFGRASAASRASATATPGFRHRSATGPGAESVARRPPPRTGWPIWQTSGLPRWHIGRESAVTARCTGAGRAAPPGSGRRTGRSRRAGASSPPPRDRAGSGSPPTVGAPSAPPASAGPGGPAG